MTARIIDCTPDEYHRLPQFSASIAKTLISRSAEVARDAYERRLEAIAAEDESDEADKEKQDRLDRGNVLHALVLGKGKRVDVIPADLLAKNGAISTTAAKAFCESSRRTGRVPVKPAKMEVYEAIATQIRRRIAEADHDLCGVSELAIAWTEETPHGPVDCKGMLDHVVMWGLSDDDRRRGVVPGAIIYDLKICDDASPAQCERTAERLHYALQAAAYVRALTALHPVLGGRVEFKFLFVEPRRPYAIWDPRTGGGFAEVGLRRWLRAVHGWGAGLATGRWADYRTDATAEINSSRWALAQEGVPTDVE
jgi:hypothetical protein